MPAPDREHEAEDSPLTADPAKSSQPADVTGVGRRVWTSEEIFAGEVEVLIAHGDQIYRLRHTRNGKLILSK